MAGWLVGCPWLGWAGLGDWAGLAVEGLALYRSTHGAEHGETLYVASVVTGFQRQLGRAEARNERE